jgi:hypothetical protein
MLIILFNFQGVRTHFKGEQTQGEFVIRANEPDTPFKKK